MSQDHLTRPNSAALEAITSSLQSTYPDFTIYKESIRCSEGFFVAAAREGETRKIISGVLAGADNHIPHLTALGDVTAGSMAWLREKLPFLKPVLTGTRTSVGLGDRTGLATPGHIAAVKGSGFVPIFAQQSVREMTRTGRSAQQVMDEATFGVFQCGYEDGFGADADHHKNAADIDLTAAAGFTFFTIDPSEHVDDTVIRNSDAELSEKFEKLVADGVTGSAGWKAKYLDKTFTAGHVTVRFDATTLLRAAVKYGRAVAHAERIAAHIATRMPAFEIELSVDETALPTTVAEHLFIAHELSERGVKIVSLAPRFIGEFEKGVEYKGDLAVFESQLRDHTAIARHYGPYKVSVHSGSDKFLLYPIVARVTEGLFHLKTAGTSYLEALRVVARTDTALFRELIDFSRGRFETDRASYHISATLEAVPAASALKDAELEDVYLNQDGGRQILHVTFGAVLSSPGPDGTPRFRNRIYGLLNGHPDLFVDVLKKHLGRHIDGLKR